MNESFRWTNGNSTLAESSCKRFVIGNNCAKSMMLCAISERAPFARRCLFSFVLVAGYGQIKHTTNNLIVYSFVVVVWSRLKLNKIIILSLGAPDSFVSASAWTSASQQHWLQQATKAGCWWIGESVVGWWLCCVGAAPGSINYCCSYNVCVHYRRTAQSIEVASKTNAAVAASRSFFCSLQHSLDQVQMTVSLGFFFSFPSITLHINPRYINKYTVQYAALLDK